MFVAGTNVRCVLCLLPHVCFGGLDGRQDSGMALGRDTLKVLGFLQHALGFRYGQIGRFVTGSLDICQFPETSDERLSRSARRVSHHTLLGCFRSDLWITLPGGAANCSK
ncbi:hypothetical protein [Streptomyces justiciae]|uniref:hypothetical protein n=1 Tax=Streptomyces justiciae TaxID=2780140 RepID=UPI00187F9D71|nr:hypothetical protein [Streptomyces justiciae]MBE8473863.1 hypothetical protein [Streptomyces justiciae]